VPNLAPFHPQIVHFVVALLIVGVLLRLVALTGKVRFAGGAATTLIVLGTVAAVLAVQSGHEAHGPVERVPGARAAVEVHEEWGERTRNVFLGVAALELVGLALRGPRVRRIVQAAAAVIGVVGVGVLYEAADHGGNLVYSYAGGVGLRTGAPEDVDRLLIAGLYHEAMLERREGKAADAARLIEELARRRPDDADVQLLVAESLVLDRQDGAAGLAALRRLPVPDGDRRLAFRRGWLEADAYEAAGFPDSARAVLEALSAAFPGNERLRQRIAGRARQP
jgi:uncharacterized membrane protein